MSDQYDVFISYSSQDAAFATLLKDALIAKGMRVWLDREQIRPGDLFVEALENGICSSKAVTLIVTTSSVNSKWVKEESSRALHMCHVWGRRLIPILLSGSIPPGFLLNRQCIDFRDDSNFDLNVARLAWGISGEPQGISADMPPSPFSEPPFGLNNNTDYVQVYFLDFGRWFLALITKPSLIGTGVYDWADSLGHTQSRIAIFMFYSVMIGAALGSITPYRTSMKNLGVVIASTAIMTFFVGAVIHCFCLLLGGSAGIRKTIFVVAQVLAAVYIMSNFVALIATTLLVSIPLADRPSILLDPSGTPLGSLVLLFTQFTLLTFYIPSALWGIHGFGRLANRIGRLTERSPASLSMDDEESTESVTNSRGWGMAGKALRIIALGASLASIVIFVVLGLLASATVIIVAWLILNRSGC